MYQTQALALLSKLGITVQDLYLSLGFMLWLFLLYSVTEQCDE